MVNLSREPLFVPETKPIDDLLMDFKNKKRNVAIAVDEWGGTSGLVTLEDVIEEVESYQNDRNYVYKEQLKHFFSCIEKGEQPSVSIHDGAIILNMIEFAKKSHKIGKKVAIA